MTLKGKRPMNLKSQRKRYYLTYTVIFALLFYLCIVFFLLQYRKSPLRIWDTYDQHYLEFIYWGRWVRNAVRTFQFPVWDPSIGYGADFFLTMQGFVCDPVNWIAIFVPAGHLSEYAFLLIVLIKMYLCGAAYSVFAFRRGHKPYAVLCGAIVYTFCACAYLGMYQSAFITPMYLFPMLIQGADDLFDRKKPGLYTAALAICAVGNFYFVYMLAILVVLYCILKWIFSTTVQKTWANLLRVVGRFALYSAWAAGMAAVSLVPVGILMLGMGRLGLQRYSPLFYDEGFYQNMFKGFIATFDMQGRDCKIGFSTLALVCVFAFFLTKTKKHRQQKVEFLLMAAGLCLPIVGRIMNGFSYVANRWIWAFAFLIGYIVTITLPKIRKMSPLRCLALLLCSAAYIVVAYKWAYADGTEFRALSIALIVLCVLFFCFRYLTAAQFKCAAVVLTCVTVVMPAYFNYSKNHADSFSIYIDRGAAYYSASQQGGLPLLNLVNTEDGTRYNSWGLPITRNASWLYGVGGMDFYMNMYNNQIDQFHNSIALNTAPWPFGYNGLDRRSEILALTGVNHFFTASSSYLPVDFDRLEAETVALNMPIQSWKPEVDHSLFSLFSRAIPYEQYEALSPYERQQAIMQACAVNAEAANAGIGDLTIDGSPLTCEIIPEDGIQAEEGKITVTRPGAGLILRFSACSDAELYVYLGNIEYENGLAMQYSVSVFGQHDGVPVAGASASYVGTTNIHHMDGGKHHWMLNLGLLREPVNETVVRFNDAGTYTLDKLCVYARSADAIRESIAGLNHVTQDLSFAPNAVSLSLDTETDAYLFSAIPYSEGWRAYDNGEPTDILNADVGFMALRLTPGHHDIRFAYHTPGLMIGFCISILSLGSYFAFRAIQKKREKAVKA